MNAINPKITTLSLMCIGMILILSAFTGNSGSTAHLSHETNESASEVSAQHFSLSQEKDLIPNGIVNGKEVICISSLGNMEKVDGDLYIWNTQFSNLASLEQLTKVGGNLYIKFNKKLSNIDGLSNLKEVGGDLFIQGNYKLNNCCALKSLISEFNNNVKGDIYINNNMNWGDCQDGWSIMRC